MISMKNICDYAGSNPGQRKFIEAERVYRAQFIIKCGINEKSPIGDKVSFTAYCMQTSAIKNKYPHEINGEISATGDISHCTCTCKAGLGEKCKHVIAALLYIYQKGDKLEVLSCTDKKCSWKPDHTKALEKYDVVAPLMQHSCFAEPVKFKKIINPSSIKDCFEHKGYEEEVEKETEEIQRTQSIQSSSGSTEMVAVKNKIKLTSDIEVSQSQLDEIACLIVNRLPMSALVKHQLGRHEPVIEKAISKVSLLEKEIIKMILEAQDSDLMRFIQMFEVTVLHECCLKTIDELSHNLQLLSENTKNYYAHWIRERSYRITGSICYKIFTYSQSKRSDIEWKKKLESTFAPKDFKTEAMEYGNIMESEARDAFRKVVNCEVHEVGLIVSRLNPWLAYSPDGILSRNNKLFALVEIKCPIIGKSSGIAETVNSQIKKCLIKEGENIIMKQKHAYYGQIQLGMVVLNVELAYFVIYSSFDKKLFILKVSKNCLFVITMLKTLKQVYFSFRLHDICIIKNNATKTDDE